MGNDPIANELLLLTRRLRQRAALSHTADWSSRQNAPMPTELPALSSPAAASGGGKGSVARSLGEIAAEASACRLCPLGATRIKAVPGVGSETARVVFVGEGPGFSEDRKGEPFVGPSGLLLDRILAAIGLSRETVFITNVVKCHPMKDPAHPDARGNDRPPSPEELSACRPFLDEQLRRISPRFIVTLGAAASRALLDSTESMTRMRGRWRDYQPKGHPAVIPLLPTFHPAALLRNPELKKDVWTDMQDLRARLAETEERS